VVRARPATGGLTAAAAAAGPCLQPSARAEFAAGIPGERMQRLAVEWLYRNAAASSTLLTFQYTVHSTQHSLSVCRSCVYHRSAVVYWSSYMAANTAAFCGGHSSAVAAGQRGAARGVRVLLFPG
jgi:hypothetical protein